VICGNRQHKLLNRTTQVASLDIQSQILVHSPTNATYDAFAVIAPRYRFRCLRRRGAFLVTLEENPSRISPPFEIRIVENLQMQRNIRPDAIDYVFAQRAALDRTIANARVSACAISFAINGS